MLLAEARVTEPKLSNSEINIKSEIDLKLRCTAVTFLLGYPMEGVCPALRSRWLDRLVSVLAREPHQYPISY